MKEVRGPFKFDLALIAGTLQVKVSRLDATPAVLQSGANEGIHRGNEGDEGVRRRPLED